MSGGHATKQYLENTYYHIYNRGVGKGSIFLDEQDYTVFLSYLKQYLLPKNEQELSKKLLDSNLSYKERGQINRILRLNNFAGEITLIAYCLMPNHFHLMLKQKSATSIDRFMNSLGTRFTIYFNRKYKRVGSLYQGVYKAVLITTDEQLLHLSKYIHKQAIFAKGTNYPSSYENYTGLQNTEWVQPNEILDFFSKTQSQLNYGSFVMQEDNLEIVGNLKIDD